MHPTADTPPAISSSGAGRRVIGGVMRLPVLKVDMKLKHELWEERGGEEYTFCLAGPHGDGARKFLSPDAKLIWTVEAGSHFEAMTAYYEFMGWGAYTTEHEWDYQPYPQEWA